MFRSHCGVSVRSEWEAAARPTVGWGMWPGPAWPRTSTPKVRDLPDGGVFPESPAVGSGGPGLSSHPAPAPSAASPVPFLWSSPSRRRCCSPWAPLPVHLSCNPGSPIPFHPSSWGPCSEPFVGMLPLAHEGQLAPQGQRIGGEGALCPLPLPPGSLQDCGFRCRTGSSVTPAELLPD